MRVGITEYLEIDLDRELWYCRRCGRELGAARENYKKFLLVYQRDPAEIHPPYVKNSRLTLGLDPERMLILEFYCPGCGTMAEVEYLPPGHPITHDIELDLDALKARFKAEEGS